MKTDINLSHLPFRTLIHMDIKAFMAVRAARNRHKWGLYATKQYCLNRGVPMGLYRLACQLEATEKDVFFSTPALLSKQAA